MSWFGLGGAVKLPNTTSAPPRTPRSARNSRASLRSDRVAAGVLVMVTLMTGCGGVDTRERDDPIFDGGIGMSPLPPIAGSERRHNRPGTSPSPGGDGRAHPATTRSRSGAVLAKIWRNGALRSRHSSRAELIAWLHDAEARATPKGRAVLSAGRRLVITERRVFRGSCWTFADAVYAAGGFARRARHRVYSAKSAGPYVDVARIQRGDFLSFINLSYRANPHSAIFVTWLDRSRREALMLSYVGGRRVRPGGYRSYNLSRVYRVQRPR